jgi:hypothetical protein
MAPHGDDHYHPKDAIAALGEGALVTGGFGLFASAIQNALQKRNVGAWAVFTRSGGSIAAFGAFNGPCNRTPCWN